MIQMQTALELDKRFGKSFYCIEATTFEVMSLLEKYASRNWIQDCRGRCQDVGAVGKYPVRISAQWYEIDGRSIMFWEAVSQVVDFEQVENWIRANCRCECTNAMNFHNCIVAIDLANNRK